MAGMFRGGHKRPTFDTPVEFISVNQTAPDRSGGYGQPQMVRGAWGAPEVMTETTVANRDDFVPTGDSGVQATNLGMFAWYKSNSGIVVLHQENNTLQAFEKTGSGQWENAENITDANRERAPLPLPQFIIIERKERTNINKNLPPISWSGGLTRYGILIDDATGQSLYYCNNQLSPPRCEHYRRAIDDGLGPASRTYMADVKDVAGAERVVGDVTVAVRTKSLVFAHATLKPLLDAEGAIAKDWKVRINGRDMDIVGVMDGWVPNRYSRLMVEDRS